MQMDEMPNVTIENLMQPMKASETITAVNETLQQNLMQQQHEIQQVIQNQSFVVPSEG